MGFYLIMSLSQEPAKEYDNNFPWNWMYSSEMVNGNGQCNISMEKVENNSSHEPVQSLTPWAFHILNIKYPCLIIII